MNITEKWTTKYGATLSIGAKEEIESILERKEFSRDEIILNSGQISRHMYIVEEGMIRQFYYKDGRDITEHFSSENDVAICIESVFLREPTRLLVQAIEPAVIYFLEYDKWIKLCDKYTDINKLYRSILEYGLVTSQRKADSWRFESSRERYERFCREYPEAVRRASVAHIATYLLMTPETLSRVRAGVL